MITFQQYFIVEASGGGKYDAIAAPLLSAFSDKFSSIRRMPGLETFKKSSGVAGQGIRLFYDIRSFRINFVSGKPHSLDIWTGKSKQPNYSISLRGMNLKRDAVDIVTATMQKQKRKVKEHRILNVDSGTVTTLKEAMSDHNEAFDGVMQFLKDKDGEPFRSGDVGKLGLGSRGMQVFWALVQMYPNVIDEVKKGSQTFYEVGGKLSDINKKDVMKARFKTADEDIGDVKVETADHDAVVSSEVADRLEADAKKQAKIPYEDQLKDMKEIVHGVVSKGLSNAVFVTGKGGTGKTHTVEETLKAIGKKYVKNTTTSSPSAMYRTLFDNKDSIILFDDADSALDDQEGRNLIKAATDTKKQRLMSWPKTSSWTYDPAKPPKDVSDYDAWKSDMKSNGHYPKSFEFTGKVIFISNLPLKKLDPDGALRTRGFIVNVDPDDDEIITFMRKIADNIPLEGNAKLSSAERQEVVDVIDGDKASGGTNIRKLVRGLNIRASGMSNWQDLIKRYA